MVRGVAVGVVISNFLLLPMHLHVPCQASALLGAIGFGLGVLTLCFAVIFWRTATILLALVISAVISMVLHVGLIH